MPNMLFARLFAALSLLSLASCGTIALPWDEPVTIAKAPENRTPAFFFVVRQHIEGQKTSEKAERELRDGMDLSETFAPFGGSDLRINVIAWNPQDELVLLEVHRQDADPERMELRLRDRRRVKSSGEESEYWLSLVRRWRLLDGSLQDDDFMFIVF